MTFARLRARPAGGAAGRHPARAAGWRIVGRNVRLPSGELDIVALDGSTLVFVEVKAGRAGATARPGAPGACGRAPQAAQARRLAREWIAERRGPSGVAGYRFDVVGVSFGLDGLADVDHIRDAF